MSEQPAKRVSYKDFLSHRTPIATSEEHVADAVHEQLWKADDEVARLRKALDDIAYTQRELFESLAAHGSWCQLRARAALTHADIPSQTKLVKQVGRG